MNCRSYFFIFENHNIFIENCVFLHQFDLYTFYALAIYHNQVPVYSSSGDLRIYFKVQLALNLCNFFLYYSWMKFKKQKIALFSTHVPVYTLYEDWICQIFPMLLINEQTTLDSDRFLTVSSQPGMKLSAPLGTERIARTLTSP